MASVAAASRIMALVEDWTVGHEINKLMVAEYIHVSV